MERENDTFQPLEPATATKIDRADQTGIGTLETGMPHASAAASIFLVQTESGPGNASMWVARSNI